MLVAFICPRARKLGTHVSWKAEIEELAQRRELAEALGGPEGVARQHERGKLTVRERIARLADPGTFREFGGLRGQGRYDPAGERLLGLTPKAQVDGMCRIEGRKVVVTGGDFTVRGGSAAGIHGGLGAELAANERAREWRLPFVRLLDAAGGSVRGFEELGRTYPPDGHIWAAIDGALLSEGPLVSAVLGSGARPPAGNPPPAPLNVLVA